jgi:hypothetical protein
MKIMKQRYKRINSLVVALPAALVFALDTLLDLDLARALASLQHLYLESTDRLCLYWLSTVARLIVPTQEGTPTCALIVIDYVC